jgi:predicted ATPase
LVGENGSGKTTILQLLYCVLAGRFSAMTKYSFESVAITIDDKRHEIFFADLEERMKRLDNGNGNYKYIPPEYRRAIYQIAERIAPDQHNLETLAERFNVPLPWLLRAVDSHTAKRKKDKSSVAMEQIVGAVNAQILHLPTYRRIEQELGLIFRGVREKDLPRRQIVSESDEGNSFVELVEFGMRDVEEAVAAAQKRLEVSARESLDNLTISYLRDVVQKKYVDVSFDRIAALEDDIVESVLARTRDDLLTTDDKAQVKRAISAAKEPGTQLDEHTKVVCHYFTLLMKMHQQLEQEEAKLVSFCDVCSQYMVNKKVQYNRATFRIEILTARDGLEPNKLQLKDLSSGEKQIVSLFCHLYLSGKERYFLIIDEPELSLSVPWQRRFVADIKRADFCAGIVAATHSPFIYDNELSFYAHSLGEFVL